MFFIFRVFFFPNIVPRQEYKEVQQKLVACKLVERELTN